MALTFTNGMTMDNDMDAEVGTNWAVARIAGSGQAPSSSLDTSVYKDRYIRQGECKRCGFCCLGGDKNEPCEYLEWDRDIAICRIYGKHPDACKSFPDAPPILTDKCGYCFVDNWTNKKLGAKEV